MLTGRETIGTAFAETGHRHRDRPAVGRQRWGDLAGRVRFVALGLAEAGVGRGEHVSLQGLDDADRWAVGLAAACIGAVVTPTGEGHSVDDMAEAVERGRRVDESSPSRFEELRDAVSPDDDAFAEVELTYTGANLLWGAASLAAALGAGPEDRLLSTLPHVVAAGWVAGVLVPVVTAASSVRGAADRPTLLVVGDADAAGLATSAAGLEGVRLALVVDAGAGARRLAETGVPVRSATAFPGHAGLVTGDRGTPLPGVTVGIADDGEVLVRSDAVAPARCDDGWLRTGRKGELDTGGRLVVVATG